MDFYLLENSNNYRIVKLRNEAGELESQATFELSVQVLDEGSGNFVNIAGTWPLNFISRGRGDYFLALPANLPLLEGVQYKALIEGVSDGRVFRERRNLFAKKRLST